MPRKPKADPAAALVDEGVALNERIKADSARLREVKAELIELGAGDYEGTAGAKASVIQVGSSIKMVDLDRAKQLAGNAFNKLFDKVTSFRPVKSFRDVAPAVLPKAKATKLIAACEVENSPQVRFKQSAD